MLLDHGHPDARDYPLGMLHDEAALVEERVNSRIITEAQLMQHAVMGILSKSARTEFGKMVKKLNVVTVPFDNEDAEPERLLPEGYGEE